MINRVNLSKTISILLSISNINALTFCQHICNSVDEKFTLMGLPFEEYLAEIKSELVQEKEIEVMERKEHKKRLLEHETMYGAGKTLTPIGNITRTPNKSRRLDSKSRLQTPGSTNRLDRLGASNSKRVTKVKIFYGIKIAYFSEF